MFLLFVGPALYISRIKADGIKYLSIIQELKLSGYQYN